MRALLVAAGIMLSMSAHGVTLLADSYDNQPDWEKGQDPGLMDQCEVHYDLSGRQGNCYDAASGAVEVKNGYGLNGSKGMRFWASESGGSTQGLQMSAYNESEMGSPGNPGKIYFGFWYKIENRHGGDYDDWGTQGSNLKWLRLYTDTESVIPTIQNGTVILFWNQVTQVTGIHSIEPGWHKYIWEFVGGAPGQIRFWVDDELVYQNSEVDWGVPNPWLLKFRGGSGASSIRIQGNLSGDYNGPHKYLYWDNFITATTLQDVLDFLGGNPGTEPPEPPPGGPAPLSAPGGVGVQTLP